MTKRCEVIIGSVVAHPCAQRAGGPCSRCNKMVCARHMSARAPEMCVECSGEHERQAAPIEVSMEELYHFSDGEIDAFDADSVPSLHDYDS